MPPWAPKLARVLRPGRLVPALIIFSALEAACVGWWEYSTKPDTIGIGYAYVASLAGIWVFESMWIRLRRLLLGMPPLGATQRGIIGPDARPFYRVLAGIMAGIFVFGMILSWQYAIRHTPLAINRLVFAVSAIYGYAFAYLAIKGKWILGRNRMLVRPLRVEN